MGENSLNLITLQGVNVMNTIFGDFMKKKIQKKCSFFVHLYNFWAFTPCAFFLNENLKLRLWLKRYVTE
jgi:hypothetical protein